ncbi:MAG: 30S ribosomal protein S3 [Thaumarchaeota archaeon]|nr:MAG: 30S ribosomal protein S3 [Nitrososphaerota archaeon]
MSAQERSAVKGLLQMSRSYVQIDEFLEKALKEAGYGGLEIQKTPIGTTLKVSVARPGLAIGRRGTGIKDLTEQVAANFRFQNPQIAVSEVKTPELNAKIMAARIAQIVSRGTAFRRAANWTLNTIMNAGAMGVEIDRSHSETYRAGIVPKSGETATKIVREATTDVLLKLGLYGIKVKIALKDAIAPDVEIKEDVKEVKVEENAEPEGEVAERARAR